MKRSWRARTYGGQRGGSIREFAAVRCNLLTLLGFAAFFVLTPTPAVFSQEPSGIDRDTSETAISNSQSGGRRFDPGAVHQSIQRLRACIAVPWIFSGAALGQQANLHMALGDPWERVVADDQVIIEEARQ